MMSRVAAHDIATSTPPHSPGAAPVGASQRIASIDLLRGVALLGILVMNIQSFAMPDAAYLNPTVYGDLTGANLWVWLAGRLFADEKMYGIFSMLFGAGILLMTSRVEAHGARPARLHFRRMAWLMLFGLLHAHLLWSGDILWFYGVGGLIVYAFRRWPPRRLVAAAVVFFAIGSATFVSVGALVRSLPPQEYQAFTQENWQPTPEMIQDEIATYRGGWMRQMPLRSTEALFMEIVVFLMFLGWKTIANMLLGMALFKWRVITGERPRMLYKRMAAAGFLIGLPIVAFGIWKDFASGWDGRYSFFFGSQYNYWGAIIVDMGWIGAIMLFSASDHLPALKAALAALGRTAFSNYILQTLICSAIFYGDGLGLFGAVSRVQQLLIVVAIWIVQLAAARWWLRHFSFGPFEWLWRSLTYWQRMPFRAA
jgi:uncharacterized protein